MGTQSNNMKKVKPKNSTNVTLRKILKDWLDSRRKSRRSRVYMSKVARESVLITNIHSIQIVDYEDISTGKWKRLLVLDKYNSVIFKIGVRPEHEYILIEEWLNISQVWINYKENY